MSLTIGVLSGCTNSDEPTKSAEPEWTANGLAYSMDLELADEVAALGGRQGTSEELAATVEFLTFVNRDGVIDAAEREIINELLALPPDGDLRYLYGSQPYADLVAPSPEAKELLVKVQKSD